MNDGAVQLVLGDGVFDFVDFGCSKGGSMAFAKKHLGGIRGVGIDLSADKVELTRSAGFDAFVLDVRELTRHPNSVRFVTMIDFLEHVPGVLDAQECIKSAIDVAREFIFIRQPWFDSDGYLFSKGLKLYWSDWRGHPNAMTSLELHSILSRQPKVDRFRIYARGRISDSSDASIHPLSSPIDQHHWDESKHDPKPIMKLEMPVFQQIMCIATLSGGSTQIEEIEKNVPFDDVLFDGGCCVRSSAT